MIGRKIWQLLRIAVALQLIGILYMFMTYTFKPNVSYTKNNMIFSLNICTLHILTELTCITWKSQGEKSWLVKVRESQGFFFLLKKSQGSQHCKRAHVSLQNNICFIVCKCYIIRIKDETDNIWNSYFRRYLEFF